MLPEYCHGCLKTASISVAIIFRKLMHVWCHFHLFFCNYPLNSSCMLIHFIFLLYLLTAVLAIISTQYTA